MYCKCYTSAVCGINGILVSVEVDIRNGLPCFQMVGGVACEVKEAKDRIRIALENSGYILPPKHITVNMSPADIKKEGTAFDLPIAAALLAAFGYIPEKNLDKYLILGELSLDGRVKKTGNILPSIFVAKEKGLKIICPSEDLKENGWSDGVPVCGIDDVEELADILSDFGDDKEFSPISDLNPYIDEEDDIDPFEGIYGNEKAKRGVILAAAGGHNIFMSGNCTDEKKKMAEAWVKLLPKLEREEKTELLKMDSVMGEKLSEPVKRRAFGINVSNLSGDHILCKAHKGVLAVEDGELLKTGMISRIKDVYENKYIKVKISDYTKQLPCSFNMAIGGRLCPCGNYPDKDNCNCTLKQVNKCISDLDPFFKKEASLWIHIYEPEFSCFLSENKDSRDTKLRINRARKKQYLRYGSKRTNGDLTDRETSKYCSFDEETERKLKELLPGDFKISDYFKMLRVARTIADLDDLEEISFSCLREAFSFTAKGNNI